VAETKVGQGVPDGARKEGSNRARVAGGEETARRAAVEGGNDGADGVRNQLAAAADLAAAQLARELEDALRRHAATLEARRHPSSVFAMLATWSCSAKLHKAQAHDGWLLYAEAHDRVAVVNCLQANVR